MQSDSERTSHAHVVVPVDVGDVLGDVVGDVLGLVEGVVLGLVDGEVDGDVDGVVEGVVVPLVVGVVHSHSGGGAANNKLKKGNENFQTYGKPLGSIGVAE